MKQAFFSGTCTALVTPFLDGKVNYPMLEQLLRRQLDAGIHTVVLAGTTGESATLTDAEKLQMIRRAKAFTGSDCLILAGTGSNDTEHTAALSEAAQAAGADGLLIVSPYYNKATDDGLIAHYLTISSRVEIPIIIYNVPGRTGQDLSPEVYQALSTTGNIVGVKEASANFTKILKTLTLTPQNFSLWSGNDELTVPIMSLGGQGVISVVSNVVPEWMAELTTSALQGDYTSAAAVQMLLFPLMQALFAEVNPIPIKAAMKLIGFDCGSCRLPLTQSNPKTLEKIRSALNLLK